MRIEALKYRTEDKQDIIIVVDFYENFQYPEWRIADIKHKTSRQREYRYFSNSFRDNWDYRKLDREDRWDYAMKKYEEFVGREKIEEAVEAAWKSIKPDLGKIGVCNI